MQVPRKVGAAVVFLCSDSVILQTPREVGAVVGIGSWNPWQQWQASHAPREVDPECGLAAVASHQVPRKVGALTCILFVELLATALAPVCAYSWNLRWQLRLAPTPGVCVGRLWAYGERSFCDTPLLLRPLTVVPCLSEGPRLLLGLHQLWYTTSYPLQTVFTQPTPVLSFGPDLQSPSLRTQAPPALVVEWTSILGCGELASTSSLFRFLLALSLAPLSLSSPLRLHFPPLCSSWSHQWGDFPVCRSLFLFHSSLPEAQVLSWLLSLFSLFFCPSLLCGDFHASLEVCLLVLFSRYSL